jgi:uncharacterized protein (DUF433 family)
MNPINWRPTGDTPNIVLDEKGRAFILGTKARVSMIWRYYRDGAGWSPCQIREAFPHLELAQIHSALSYYYDHRDAIDGEIAEEDRYVEATRAQAENRPDYQALMEKVRRYSEATARTAGSPLSEEPVDKEALAPPCP